MMTEDERAIVAACIAELAAQVKALGRRVDAITTGLHEHSLQPSPPPSSPGVQPFRPVAGLPR